MIEAIEEMNRVSHQSKGGLLVVEPKLAKSGQMLGAGGGLAPTWKAHN